MVPVDLPFIAFTVFDCPLTDLRCQVVEQVDIWSTKVGRRSLVTQVEADRLDLPVQEYNPKGHRVLLWEPASHAGSAVFVANLQDGWNSLVWCLRERHSPTSYFIRVSQPGVQWPIVEFDGHQRDGRKRFVRAMKDDPKRQFFQSGTPLPFESLDVFRRRRIADRFPREALFDYLRCLGWDVKDPAFWKTTLPAWTVARGAA